MLGAASNVVRLPSPVEPTRRAVALATLDQAREILERLEVTAQVCQRIIEKSDSYGEERAREAMDQVLQTFFATLRNM